MITLAAISQKVMYGYAVQVFKPGGIIYSVIQFDNMAAVAILANEGFSSPG